jgi:hypothetical protein
VVVVGADWMPVGAGEGLWLLAAVEPVPSLEVVGWTAVGASEGLSLLAEADPPPPLEHALTLTANARITNVPSCISVLLWPRRG